MVALDHQRAAASNQRQPSSARTRSSRCARVAARPLRSVRGLLQAVPIVVVHAGQPRRQRGPELSAAQQRCASAARCGRRRGRSAIRRRPARRRQGQQPAPFDTQAVPGQHVHQQQQRRAARQRRPTTSATPADVRSRGEGPEAARHWPRPRRSDQQQRARPTPGPRRRAPPASQQRCRHAGQRQRQACVPAGVRERPARAGQQQRRAAAERRRRGALARRPVAGIARAAPAAARRPAAAPIQRAAAHQHAASAAQVGPGQCAPASSSHAGRSGRADGRSQRLTAPAAATRSRAPVQPRMKPARRNPRRPSAGAHRSPAQSAPSQRLRDWPGSASRPPRRARRPARQAGPQRSQRGHGTTPTGSQDRRPSMSAARSAPGKPCPAGRRPARRSGSAAAAAPVRAKRPGSAPGGGSGGRQGTAAVGGAARC